MSISQTSTIRFLLYIYRMVIVGLVCKLGVMGNGISKTQPEAKL